METTVLEFIQISTDGDIDMQIEDYFNFLAEDDIRIKGTRIGIETVLDEYIHNNKTPEEIADRYHTVTLEQVYATILYYLQNQEKVGAYLEDYLEYCRKAREEFEKNPPPGVIRLRQLIPFLIIYLSFVPQTFSLCCPEPHFIKTGNAT